MSSFQEYKKLNLANAHKNILEQWQKNNTFKKSIDKHKNNKNFNFYEGPPSANGMPGIHHVIARTLKDLICRYKSLKGYKVNRKAGWDTHGLPIELGVEKELGINKDDIGSKISINEYNNACRSNVMRYKNSWEDITKKMGYWVDLDNPYITYENKYIESVWWLLSKLHEKDLLYKGHTIQPFSPKAGTGLSTHELNQPGCYKNVKDTSTVAQFKIINNKLSNFLFSNTKNDIFFLAWTTTPWTLPSNTALAVGAKINYLLIETLNQYTGEQISVIIAKELAPKFFPKKNSSLSFSGYKKGNKNIPFKVLGVFDGKKFNGLSYEQLFKYEQPQDGDAFKVVLGDFVTTQDGTGIVHMAPSFGADDNRVAKQNGIGSLTLVDKQGKFLNTVTDFANMYVKNEYYEKEEDRPKLSADIQIIIYLKEKGYCFHSEKYEHSYPHCWRTDMPILYYPLDSWFIKTTDFKERMIELNKTINWKPHSTGEGRFGKWLENLVDWNLSRSRFWGIPIPIWKSKNGDDEICISSIEQLKKEIEKSISAGFMNKNILEKFSVGDMNDENYTTFDLHRPYVDEIVLVSKSGSPMYREIDLIDVWFDSGAMPYAQLHYPFENKDVFEQNFPADFIAEGVDQTRGWFFTLHAISSMLFDSVAYKNVISNGLVLDKNGNKMSKRLANAIDPFNVIDKYGADATRWYMVSNAQPWDNLKFDEDGIIEVQRKFFGTLYNTYSFFALYANIDGFTGTEEKTSIQDRNELDRWIISELNTLIKQVENNYNDYEPTTVTRLIQAFVIDKLSNWYVRLSRRRFWKDKYSVEKIAAYQTLHECLINITIISSPIAPFYTDQLYQDLKKYSHDTFSSVHLSDFPTVNEGYINDDLQRRVGLAQKITSVALSLRKKEKIRVRQPLQKVVIPVLDKNTKEDIESVAEILKHELNIKKVEIIDETSTFITKKIKPNFKTLGPKYGKDMNFISKKISEFNSEDIKLLEREKTYKITDKIILDINDFEISTGDVEGYSVSAHENITVALDIAITEELKDEGLAREFVNRIQNLRKEIGLEVTDKITIRVEENHKLSNAIKNNFSYICEETLALTLYYEEKKIDKGSEIQLIENLKAIVLIEKN